MKCRAKTFLGPMPLIALSCGAGASRTAGRTQLGQGGSRRLLAVTAGVPKVSSSSMTSESVKASMPCSGTCRAGAAGGRRPYPASRSCPRSGRPRRSASSRWNRALASCGLAWPLVRFMSWPTKKPITLPLPSRYCWTCSDSPPGSPEPWPPAHPRRSSAPGLFLDDVLGLSTGGSISAKTVLAILPEMVPPRSCSAAAPAAARPPGRSRSPRPRIRAGVRYRSSC